jgi:biopolymer transport protein ExbB
MNMRRQIRRLVPALALSAGLLPGLCGGQPAASDKLEEAQRELAAARERIADEKIPMMRTLSDLETRLMEARDEFEKVRRTLDKRNLNLNNLRSEIKSREQENSYLSTLLGEYIRNFETKVHIAEWNRYERDLERARLAPENSNLRTAEVFEAQVGLVDLSVQRLEDMLGGDRFPGRAVGEDGLVKPGRFLLLGPVVYFLSEDGSLAGIAEQRLGSLEPAVIPYGDPALQPLTAELVAEGTGLMPFDASLGNARKVEETQETLGEHIAKGGVVMVPILILFGAVLLIAFLKWLSLAFVLLPTPRRLEPLLRAVEGGDDAAAEEEVKALKGPAGDMLRVGVAHLRDSKDLIEEVLYEKLLSIRFKFNRALPFIAIGAASAPLLGLLGTVTGIINTFKLITVFGSGDVKMLSSGISEALITTEFGLIVAIPSLLLHAFLSRKAKALLDKLERLSITFLSAVTKAREGSGKAA